MSRNNDLPFERGSTYYEGVTADIAADTVGPTNLQGKRFLVYDPTTGQEITLMVVKNDGSTLTTPAGKGVLPDAGNIDRAINGFVGTAGAYGYVVDSAHVGDFVAGDYGYVIVGGFAKDCVLGASNAVDLAVAVFNNAGQLIPVGSTDGYVVGRFAEAVTSTGAGNERVDCIVGGGAANYND
jgi:hypothetical protein